MKKSALIAVAPLCLLSFSAFAGDNCLYGKDKSLAIAPVEDAVIAEKVDPALLALVKKQQAEKEQAEQIITFN